MADASNYPDVGNGEVPCCYGSAMGGPECCTCWRPVYEPKHQLPVKEGPRRIRPSMCADCAYRTDSPERNSDERYAHSDDPTLGELTGSDTPFICHQGMRRLVVEIHPSGAELAACPGAYTPGAPPRKADGSPVEYCAGWWAAKQQLDEEP